VESADRESRRLDILSVKKEANLSAIYVAILKNSNNIDTTTIVESILHLLTQFLMCISITAHVIDIGWTSVCPSVCLSIRHTLVLCRNGLTYRQNVFTAW